MAKIIGPALANMPWEDKPAGEKEPIWRYSGNPIIGRHGNQRSNSVFNSAVVPFRGGFAGVFRCDSRSISMDLFAGRSQDGLHWEIDDEPILLTGADGEIAAKEYRYDARITPMEGKYYITWCNGYHGPTIGVAWTEDFKTFHQLENAFLPFNRNGLKFFVKEGGLEASDINEIIAVAEAGGFAKVGGGKCESIDFMTVYAKILVDKIRKGTGKEQPLSGCKIVVDAGNGAGGFFVRDVLVPLGADTTGSQFLEPDGMFPNHIPNPEDKKAGESISKAVLAAKADLGIIFDTDVDRAGAVDPNGRVINRNRLIALISKILLLEFPGTTIVTDSTTSSGLAKFIAANGGVHHRFKRGYKNVIDEGIRLNKEGHDCQLAIETSGHAALKENYFLDDGAYLITKILITMANMRDQGKDMFSLIASLEEPAEAEEFRLNIKAEDFKAYGARVIEKVKAATEANPAFTPAPTNYEGIRVSLDKAHGDGWFLIRKSLHEPIMPLNIESDSKGGVAVMAGGIKMLLEKAGGPFALWTVGQIADFICCFS